MIVPPASAEPHRGPVETPVAAVAPSAPPVVERGTTLAAARTDAWFVPHPFVSKSGGSAASAAGVRLERDSFSGDAQRTGARALGAEDAAEVSVEIPQLTARASALVPDVAMADDAPGAADESADSWLERLLDPTTLLAGGALAALGLARLELLRRRRRQGRPGIEPVSPS
jgi:hypothetical protein